MLLRIPVPTQQPGSVREEQRFGAQERGPGSLKQGSQLGGGNKQLPSTKAVWVSWVSEILQCKLNKLSSTEMLASQASNLNKLPISNEV